MSGDDKILPLIPNVHWFFEKIINLRSREHRMLNVAKKSGEEMLEMGRTCLSKDLSPQLRVLAYTIDRSLGMYLIILDNRQAVV